MKDPLRDAARWFTEAEIDLAAARVLSEHFSALACFHTQQAAEKALKAILHGAGERPVLGHSLGELGGLVERHSPRYKELWAEVAKLDRYYIPTRYPNGLPAGGQPSEAFDEKDAREAIAIAAKSVAYAREFLDERAAGGET